MNLFVQNGIFFKKQYNSNFCPVLDHFAWYYGKREFQKVFRGFGLLKAISQHFPETKIMCVSLL